MRMPFKGVPMLESGSALEDETLTIRFAALENPENFGRKYPAAHLEKIMANLPILDSHRNRVKFSQRGLSSLRSNNLFRCSESQALICHLNDLLKNIEKIFMNFFVEKISIF